jgi:hypothetical protein
VAKESQGNFCITGTLTGLRTLRSEWFMHCVQYTHAFLRAAAEAGMSDAEIEGLELLVARNPLAGSEIAGTSGCRKIRLAGRGKGKRGGFRVVTFYSGTDIPVILITVFSKGDQDNLSKAERNALAEMTKELVTSYRGRVVRVSGGRR